MSLYVIQNSETGNVKIGIGSPGFRLRGLQTGNEAVLHVIAHREDWGRPEEKEAHRRLAPFRIRGEWFRYEGPVVQFVKWVNPQAPSAGKIGVRSKHPPTKVTRFFDAVLGDEDREEERRAVVRSLREESMTVKAIAKHVGSSRQVVISDLACGQGIRRLPPSIPR